MHSSRMRTARFSYRRETPPWRNMEHGTRDTDPLEGTWYQTGSDIIKRPVCHSVHMERGGRVKNTTLPQTSFAGGKETKQNQPLNVTLALGSSSWYPTVAVTSRFRILASNSAPVAKTDMIHLIDTSFINVLIRAGDGGNRTGPRPGPI